MLAGEPGLKLQDVAGRVVALGLPDCHGLLGGKQARKIDMRPVAAAQRTAAKPVSDVKSPVSIFNLSRPINFDSGVQTVPAHSKPSPSLNTSERFEIEADNLNGGNTGASVTFPVNATPLRTAPFFRQAEEQFRLLSPVTKHPANDCWHPLGAA